MKSEKKEKSEEPGCALHKAVAEGDIDRLQSLLQTVTNVNETDRAGNTALHVAACCHDGEAVRLLLDAGADMNARNALGFTPLDLCDGSQDGTVCVLYRE